MTTWIVYMLLAAVPGLMFFIIPVDGAAFRLSWHLAALWMGGTAFAFLLSSWRLRVFWGLALVVTALQFPPVADAYLCLVSVAIFLAAAEGFGRIHPEKIMGSMRLAAALLLAWIFAQEMGLVKEFWPARNAGPFNPNAGGVFLAMCLPAFLARGWWIAIPAIVAGMACTETTTAAVAALAGFGVWLLLTTRGDTRVRPMMLCGFLAAAVALTAWLGSVKPLEQTMTNPRWAAWRVATLSLQTVQTGRGLGSWEAVFPLLASGVPALNVPTTADGQPAIEVFHQAHNEYLQAAFEMGLQTLFYIMAVLAFYAVAAWRKRMTPQVAAGLTITAVACAGFFAFHVAPTALLGVAWIGMAEQGLLQGNEVQNEV